MNNRVLQHYRFGKTFARISRHLTWINRHTRGRHHHIKKIRALYQKLGLTSNGCTVCQGKDFVLIAQGDRYGFDLDKQFCNQCGLVQTYPALSAEFHQEFYRHHYRPLYLKSKTVNYQRVIKEQIHKGKKYLAYFKANGLTDNALKQLSIIEIGCSSGGTLNTLKPFVQSVCGCDLDIKAIEFAKHHFDISVEVSMYPTHLPEGRKLFILSHILEHVQNPVTTLKQIRTLMHQDDYLFIAVPGLNEVAKGDYKNDLRSYFHIAHVSDFTANTLTNVARVAGLKTLKIDEEISALLTRGNTVAWQKHPEDSIQNLQRIDKTYRGLGMRL